MKIKLTAIYEKSPFGYIGYIGELSGANTQGKTLEETKENLIEAIKMVLEANKFMIEEDLKNKEFIKEEIGELVVWKE